MSKQPANHTYRDSAIKCPTRKCVSCFMHGKAKRKSKFKTNNLQCLIDTFRSVNWGKGVLAQISERLRGELPGLRGFSSTNLKNMRLFYEAWNMLEHNSVVATAEIDTKSSVTTDKL